MATLTEKEIPIESGLNTLYFYAEYADGRVTDIFLLMEIDGNRLGNSPGLRIYNSGTGTFTSFFLGLDQILRPDLMAEVNKTVQSLLN